MKGLLLSFLICVSSFSFACDCPSFVPISKELSSGYDVVFYGLADSVSICDPKGVSTVYFTIKELYKGNSEKQTKVEFDCASECLMSFEKGEEWLIYSKYVKFDLLRVSFCDHSRKKFKGSAEDVNLISAQRTFEKEKEFLKSTFGLQYFIQPNDLNKQQNEIGPHNDQPSGWGKLILLVISVSVMGAVYYVTRKKK